MTVVRWLAPVLAVPAVAGGGGAARLQGVTYDLEDDAALRSKAREPAYAGTADVTVMAEVRWSPAQEATTVGSAGEAVELPAEHH